MLYINEDRKKRKDQESEDEWESDYIIGRFFTSALFALAREKEKFQKLIEELKIDNH